MNNPCPGLDIYTKHKNTVLTFRLELYVHSIGSLGKSGNYVQVQNILVKDVKFIKTSNGARIKTWQVNTSKKKLSK